MYRHKIECFVNEEQVLGTYKTVKFTGSDQNPSKYSLESIEIVVSGIFFHGLRMRNKNNVLGLKMCVDESKNRCSANN